MLKTILTILLGWMWMVTAYAGIQFSPIQMFIKDPKKQKSTTVTIESTGLTNSRIYEVSAFKWSQNELGEDILTEDETLLFNPKTFELKPENKQLVRIGFGQPSEVELTEQTWRILFTEVTPIDDTNSINFQFNFSLPLFVGQQDSTQLAVAMQSAQAERVLTVQNLGQSHVKIIEVVVLDAKNQPLAKKQMTQYVLANNKINIPIGQMSYSGNLKIKIKTEDAEKYLEYMIKG